MPFIPIPSNLIKIKGIINILFKNNLQLSIKETINRFIYASRISFPILASNYIVIMSRYNL